MDLASIAILFAVALGLIIYGAWPRATATREAMRRRLEGRRQVDRVAEARAKATRREKFVRRAAPVLSRLVMPLRDEEVSELRIKLMQAGYRSPAAQTIFLGMKTTLLVVGGIAGAAAATAIGYGPSGIVGAFLCGAGLGFLAPGLWLSMAIKARRERIRRALPDVLDLTVVSVEAGLALDAAIRRVGEEMALVHPDLSDELRITTIETQMGIPRAEALENMSLRVGLDELRSLVSTLIQAERFGTSIGKALRNQSDVLRTKRRQEAEERAQKTAVKLLIPLVLFIFPAMGVVLAGPAAIRLMETFGK